METLVKPSKGKKQKGSPKLKRSGRHKNKYKAQETRTFYNKLRRVRKHNGTEAAKTYEQQYSPW